MVRSTRPPDYRSAAAVVLGIIAAGGIAVALWPLSAALALPVPLAPAPMIAHVCGMLAGYGVLVLVVFMSRWPVLERGVGSDRLARWHAAGGRVVLTLVLLHAFAAVEGWAESRGENLLVALWHVLGLPWLISATVATALLVAIAVVSARAARQRLSYEAWHSAHLLAYLAIALSFLHQLGGPDLAGHRVLQVLWALMYTHAFGLVLRYRVLTPIMQATRHRLRVEAVVPEAPGIVSIVLTGRHLDELGAEPGQFFRWRFLTPDTWMTAHPFSLSAPARSDRLRLTVKGLGDGSSRLQHLEPGTWVAPEGPYGAMTAAHVSSRNVLLIAAGVGITPLRALFETIPTAPGQDLTLLYRARNREQVVFRSELDAIAARRRAHVIYLLGDNPDLLSADSMQRLVPDLAHRDVYLCGPPRMADAVRAAVSQAGLPPARLHEERFAF